MHAFSFTASQKGIQAGAAPDKTKVTVLMDGRKLSPDEFDLVYDKSVRSGGLEVTIAPKAPYDNTDRLVPRRISAGNFYKTRTYGNVYDFGQYEMTYILDIYDYTFTDGDGSTWTKYKDTEDLSFTVKRIKLGSGKLNDLYKEVQIDGKTAAVKNVTFKNEYVQFSVAREDLLKLANGKHDITAVFTDGKAGGTFTVKEAPKVTVTVTKVWDDDSNRDGLRPTTASYAKLISIEDQTFTKAAVKPVIKDNGDNTYTITYKGLLPMVNWTAAEYTVNELPVAGYKTTRDWAKNGGTMTSVRDRSARLVSGHVYTILSAKDDSFALDIAGGSRIAGANADIYKKNGTEAQAFVISKANDGGWKIMNYKGMMLTVEGASKSSGANVQTAAADGSSAQSFKVQENADGTITLINSNSGLVLDVAGGKMANKQNVRQYKANGSAAQKWVLLDITDDMKKTCPRTWQGTYLIRSAVNNGFVLDIRGGSKADKANVQIYKSNGSAAQKFRLTYRGDGFYSITNVNSGRVLAVDGSTAANGLNVWQSGWNGSKAQLWQVAENADGTVTFKSTLNVACALDIYAGKAQNGQNVQIWKANGSKAQKWALKKA